MKEKNKLFDMKLLGNSIASARAMCKEDRACKKRARKNMDWMKKNKISVADMAGFAH